MAKRQESAGRSVSGSMSARSATDVAIRKRVVALAEKMGRMVASAQTQAEGWLSRKVLSEQLLELRAGANELLAHLGVSSRARKRVTRPKSSSPKARARSGGVVDAPGKKHRKPLPADPDASVAKSQAAKMREAEPRGQIYRRSRQG